MIPDLLFRLRALFRRNSMDEELDEELRAHIERQAEKYVGSGMPVEAARRRAHLEFGGHEQVKEECRDARGVRFIETTLQDLRYGLRMLLQNRVFTAVAVLSLALGIGANTAIFSLIDAVLLKTLPVDNPQQLVLLSWASQGWADDVLNGIAGNTNQDKSGRMTSSSFPYPTYEQISARNDVFSSVLALAGNSSELNVGYNGQPGRADGELVSGTFFSTLGVQPALGRTLIPDDDRIGASPAAVISYGYWKARFGGDSAVVGRAITVNSVPFKIIGVLPPEFYGVQPGRAVDVWLPLHAQPLVEPRWWTPEASQAYGTGSLFEVRNQWWVVVIGRLKAGISEQQARTDSEIILQQTIAPNVQRSTKPENLPHVESQPASKGLSYLRTEFSKPLFILMTVVALVLLIACANAANLLLARAAFRQKEIALRLAIGAGRGRLVRQLLTESVLLAGVGGLLGLLLAFWSTDVLLAFMSSGREPIHLSVTPDPRVLGFTATVSVLTGILFGLLPALRSSRLDLTPALKESGREFAAGMTSGQRGMRFGLGKGLVVTQVALSVLLLIGAGLFVRTLTNLQNLNAGFNQRNLLLFGIDPTQDGYQGERLATFYRELDRRVEKLPSVLAVGSSQGTLIGGGVSILRTQIPGFTPKPGQNTDEVASHVNWVGPGFFETLGIPLVLGRTIGDGDTAESSKVAVVNQQFVREFLGGGNPIGRRLGFGDKKISSGVQIVGVAGDAKYSDLRQTVPATLYLPYKQNLKMLGPMHFEVRTAGNPMNLASAVRREARDMDRNLALFEVNTQVEQINQSLFQERLFARLTSFFGALAAVLACVGIYGIMAFAVTRRTREIGIRMALGASRREISGMVLREASLPVGIGIAIGTLLALGSARLIATLLYGLTPTDPLTLATAILLMTAAAALAAHLPSRRASKVDPMLALRHE
jgi:predicted permease